MQIILILAIAILFAVPAYNQSTPTATVTEKKKITIISKTTDETGKSITKTWIMEGDDPEQMLEGIETGLQETALKYEELPESEKLFVVRRAGTNTIIEGRLQDLKDIEMANAEPTSMAIKIQQVSDENPEAKAVLIARRFEQQRNASTSYKRNCAALGVYAHAYSSNKGAVIQSLIDKGGAQEAGLKAGDIITKIEEFDITDFATLNMILGHFNIGENVRVEFLRNGESLAKNVTLKNWKDLPGFEKYSNDACLPEPQPDPVLETRDDGIDGPVYTIESLDLHDISVYPNPVSDHVSVSFSCQPGELSVQMTDINGKVVYQDKENGDGNYARDIPMKQLPQGQYVLYVRQGNKLYAHNISKQ